MTSMSKGSNMPVPQAAMTVAVTWQLGGGVPDVDASALLLGADGKVANDDAMIFYNAPTHSSGSVSHTGKSGGRDTLVVDLARVPGEVERVVVAASADGGTFGQVPGLALVVSDAAGGEVARFEISDASGETAFQFGEFYRRAGAWKFRAVGQGWDTGLAGLATDFGISVDDEPAAPAPAAPPAPAPTPVTPPPPAPVSGSAPPPPPSWANQGSATPPPPPAPSAPPPAPAAAAPAGISLKKQKLVDMEKRVAASAPAMLSLTKKAAVSLEKRGLGEHTARVAIALDISGSMGGLYRSKKIQALVERVLALGLRFDDDGEVDVFLFGSGAYHDQPVTLSNYASYTDDMLRRRRLEGGTNYGKVLKMIREHYFGSSSRRSTPLSAKSPVYLMFVTDGQTQDEGTTREQVVSGSYEPLFVQFMAIGSSPKAVDAAGGGKGGGLGARFARALASDFKFLEELDDMGGRFTDNADFFAVQDPANLSDEQLYELLTNEYAGWVPRVRGMGLITG